jgi:hypothetical protein
VEIRVLTTNERELTRTFHLAQRGQDGHGRNMDDMDDMDELDKSTIAPGVEVFLKTRGG